MQSHVRQRILDLTRSKGIARTELIQPLWNNYGTLSRVFLEDGAYPSVIVKHIQIPDQLGHPRGFASSISRDRKVRSYQVETHWYQHQNGQVSTGSPTPRCLDSFSDGGELFLLLEDLGTRGFKDVLYSASWAEMAIGLRWLAHFHAQFLGDPGQGLWPCGTYWHLAARPEELANIEGTRLHCFASLLDARLRCGGFPTLVHGDAKLANFLFNDDHSRVAAVDFQYVGCGAAMKDVAYFVGSCMRGEECERLEADVLAVYFAALRDCLSTAVDAEALEEEWRALYPVAWADFQRFMVGWSPGHRKLSDYSDATTERAIHQMTDELLAAAREACLMAERVIQESGSRTSDPGAKNVRGELGDGKREMSLDVHPQIVDSLRPTLARYDLGLFAEESGARPHKHAYWVIESSSTISGSGEELPRTLLSIALVCQSGRPLLSVRYDPLERQFHETVAGDERG